MQLIQNAYKTKAVYTVISSLIQHKRVTVSKQKKVKRQWWPYASSYFQISNMRWNTLRGIWLLHFPFISSNGLLRSPLFYIGRDPHCSSDRWSLFFGRPTGLWAGWSNLQKQMWSRNGVCNQQKFEFLNNAMNNVFMLFHWDATVADFEVKLH